MGKQRKQKIEELVGWGDRDNGEMGNSGNGKQGNRENRELGGRESREIEKIGRRKWGNRENGENGDDGEIRDNSEISSPAGYITSSKPKSTTENQSCLLKAKIDPPIRNYC